jgi:hypothetical protein
MIILRAAVLGLGLLLAAAILWASLVGGDLHGGLFDQVGVFTTLPWGIVTLADLYVGFALFAAIVFLAERSWLSAALWALPLPFLGNVWAAVWLALRLPSLVRRLNRPDPGPS